MTPPQSMIVMQNRIVAQNVANLYTEPDTSSALASQAVLGQRVSVLEEQNGFCRVATEDRYESWIASRLLTTPQADTDLLRAVIETLIADVYSEHDARSEIVTKLSAGTRVAVARRPEAAPWVPVLLPDVILPEGQAGYVHQVSLNQAPSGSLDLPPLGIGAGISRTDLVSALGITIAATAKRFIGTPYLWGGTTAFGIDCSGLTQLVYKLNGIQLLRDAHLQFADKRFVRAEEGQPLENAILDAGDLVAFSREGGQRPTHIGLALGDGRFLHSRGGQGVRIDFCDSEDYAASYLGAARLSADADFSVQSA